MTGDGVFRRCGRRADPSRPGARRIRVLAVEADELWRDSIRRSLLPWPRIEMVAVAADGAGAVRLALERSPDVVLIDVAVPGSPDSAETTRRILGARPCARVIALTHLQAPGLTSPVLHAGALACLHKSRPAAELAAAIQAAAGLVEDGALAPEWLASGSTAPDDPRLSGREEEVLALLASGIELKEIAWNLRLSPKTVDAHRRRVLRKLKARTVAGLVLHAIRRGLVPPEALAPRAPGRVSAGRTGRCPPTPP